MSYRNRKSTDTHDRIDVVITWVNGGDSDWLKKKNEYMGLADQSSVDARSRRFRDWDNLVYLFRGISKYTPWVNHVYLVTPNQCPEWLNQDCEKVTLINQDDLFEDKSVLPTFNNCSIELLLHKIPGLSEQFVYLNDDMFILRKTSATDFFRDGLPCITAAFAPPVAEFTEDFKGVYGINVMNTRLVGRHFKKKDVFRKNWRKYLDPRNGREIIKTLCCLPFYGLVGFNEMHTAYSYLKSTFEEVWEVEGDQLREVSNSKFRGEFSVNHHAMRYWQMAKGDIAIRRRSFSKMFDLHHFREVRPVLDAINKGRPNMICINDNVEDEADFEPICTAIKGAFQNRLPEKCEYELQ